MIIHVAETSSEWAEECKERDRYRCASKDHAEGCTGAVEEVHHIKYRSAIPDWAYNLIENGICLSVPCHKRAHSTHNGSLPANRVDEAQKALNVLLHGRSKVRGKA